MSKVIILLAFFVNLAKAEVLSLNDLSQKQIIKTYGKPDKIVKNAEKQSQWIYGESLIFFKEGKVTAWSDQGDLLNSKSEFIKFDIYMKNWDTPWSYRTKEKKEKIFLDYLKDKLE